MSTMSSNDQVARFDMVQRVRGMESWHEMKSDPTGEWCRYEDVEAEIKWLRKTLNQYGRHSITCDLLERGSANGGKCNCGWEQASVALWTGRREDQCACLGADRDDGLHESFCPAIAAHETEPEAHR